MASPVDTSNRKLRYILAFTALTLFIIGYLPVFQILVNKWANSEGYSHAFITVPIIIYMVWGKREFLINSQGVSALIGLPLVIVSILLYLVSLQLQIPTFSSLAMVMTLLSVLVYLAGFMALKELATPILLLLVIIPIPNQLYSMATLPLQLKVSQVSEVIIRLLGIPVLREGNIIQIPDKSFQIVEACSGMRSIITLITLSLIMGYYMLTRTFSKGLLLVMSVPVAFFINVVRVVVLVWAFHFVRMDLSEGTKHTILGLVLFAIALIILLVFQRVLENWETKEQSS